MLRKSKNEKRHVYYHDMIPDMIYRKEHVNRYCPVYQLRLRRILHKLSVWRGTKDYTKEQLRVIDGRWMRLQNLLKSIDRRTA